MIRRIRLPGLGALVDGYLNRNLSSDRRIHLQVAWPLFALPWLLALQLIDPSGLWMVLMIGIIGFYGAGLAWVRVQVPVLHFTRQRRGTMLVAGDALREEFVLHNPSLLPLLWLVFEDESYLPGYNPSQVVSCGAGGMVRWHREAVCHRRGVFRLGPHRLLGGDPFGLFRVEIVGKHQESLVVYPRVAHLPALKLPRGHAAGRNRQHRPLLGDLRAPQVRPYQAGDSLRHIHWPTTAHRGQLIVTELEEEPSGDLWIVLDLNREAHHGSGERSTLEYGVVLAASVAAELLGSSERRAVGLLAVGQDTTAPLDNQDDTREDATLAVPPQRGQGQLWRILAALAPVHAGGVAVSDLLRRNRGFLGKGHTVVVITADIGSGAPDWLAELLYLRRSGVRSSVLAVIPAEEDVAEPSAHEAGSPQGDSGDAGALTPREQTHLDPAVEARAATNGEVAGSEDTGSQQDFLAEMLARHEIPVHFVEAGTPLRPALTYRRLRTVLRTTPTGGVVAYEVEEEVG